MVEFEGIRDRQDSNTTYPGMAKGPNSILDRESKRCFRELLASNKLCSWYVTILQLYVYKVIVFSLKSNNNYFYRNYIRTVFQQGSGIHFHEKARRSAAGF